MKIYRPDGKLWREVVALDSSFCEETLERFGRISLDFVLAEEVPVPELCYVTWRGERYSLFSTPKVVKVSTREYRYTLNLEGRHMELDRVLVKDKLGRTKFVFTGRTDQYAELISGCLPGWKVGTCTTGDATRVMAFNNTSLLEACRMVASKFETEVQLTDGAISFGRLERYKSDPLLLAYREGLKKDITVEPDPKETAIGRLYVVGGNRNIDPAKYGGHQLHLPKGGKVAVGGHSFVADAEGRYISLEGDTRLNTSERAFDASSVYPKRVGTVSKAEQVGDEWDVLDDTNTIDYGRHRVGGDTMRLEFQSGRLAGRTFDLATKDDKLVGYVHSEKRFKLVRKEIDGVLMPEPATFYPAVGDKYAIFGCSLPDEYITSAEGEMLLKGAEYMAERLEPRLQYRAELDGLWAKKNWGTVAHKLVVGTIVKLEGASSEVRISSVRTSLNSSYTPRITFSNAPYMVGSLATQIATLENAEVRQREETRQSLMKLQNRTYKETEAVREMVERLKVEGFSKALKPETLQTMYAVIGSPALQFEFKDGAFAWTEGKGGAVTIPRQVIRQRVAGTTLEPEPETVETTIPPLTYTLKAEEQQAYVYTELKPTPRYVVSTKPLEVTPDRLLIGLLNGGEGSRDFTPLYGFTEISPSHIATRYIRSRSGNMLIDLETGEILSDHITFRRPDGSRGNLTEAIDTIQKTPGPKGEDGKDATPVRENLWTFKRYTLSQNDNYGCRLTILPDGEIKIEKKEAAKASWFSAASYYTNPIKNPPGRYTISFKVVECSRPIRFYYNTGIDKKKGDLVGGFYYYTSTTSNGRLPAFSFTWGEADTDDQAKIGDYAIIKDIKIERVEEGEDPHPTAYLPHPDDLIGKDGISIKLVDVEYAVNTSAATPPTAGWATDAPTISGSQQLWTRTKTTYSSGSPTYTKPANITPQKGDTGKSVDSVTEEYAISTSKTTQPTSGWSETQPQWEQGKYIWSRSKIVYKNPASTTYTGYSCSSEWEAINSIQVGGRNLLLKSDTAYSNTDYYVGKYYISDPSQMIEGETYTIRIWGEADGADLSEALWVYNSGGNVEVANIQQRVKGAWTQTFKWRDDLDKLNSFIYIFRGANHSNYKRGSKTTITRMKLERGTVATDWTPAPEDVQAEIDAINANPPRINDKGTWEVYVPLEGKYVDTKRTSKGDDGHAPKIENGYWVEWDSNLGKYTPTGIKAQGKDGKSAFILRLEHTEGTVIGGKVNGHIFLKLRPSYGGEEILLTDEEVDPDKEINFTDTTILYNLGNGWEPVDTQSLEMQCLPINGHEAPKGVRVMATAKYKGMVASDTLYIPNLPDPKVLEKVESGLTNANTALKSLKEASEKMITSDKIKWLLDAYNNGKTTVAGGLILSKIIALSNDVDRITAYLSGYDAAGGDGKILRAGIRYEQTLVPTGKRVRRKWIDAIAWAIDARMGVGTAAKVFNAYPYNDYDATEVEFQHWMTNIRDNFNIDIDDVIADLRNYNAVLDMSADPYEESPAQWYYEMDLYEATHTDSGSENVAIRHDGTGHFGDIHFAGDRIDYIDQATGEAYLSVGNVVNESIQDVVRKNSVDRTVTLSSASGIREGNVSVAGHFTIENDNTRVFLQYDLAVGYDHDTPSGRRYGGYAEMRIKNASSPNADPWIITTPAYSGLARYGTFEKAMVNMRAGEYVVEIRSIGPYTSTGYRNFTVRQVYTSDLKQSFITPRGIRFYGSPQKFVDFDYSATGPGLTIGGGLSIDYIDTPGIPLCGAMVTSSGSIVKSFGKYKNRSGASQPQVSYSYSTNSYTVYHSIPHDKYVPMLTVGNNDYSDQASYRNVRAYSFEVTISNGQKTRLRQDFSYICFLAE